MALSDVAFAGLQELTCSEDLTSALPQQTNVEGLIFSAWTGTRAFSSGCFFYAALPARGGAGDSCRQGLLARAVFPW